MDEAQFRQALRDRDPGAWAEAYRRHSRQLSRQARLILPSDVDADDAVSEVWLRGYRGARGYDPNRPPYPWLSKICLHVCLSARRKRRPEPLPPGADPAARSVKPEGRYDEARTALRLAMEELPRRPREVLSLRYLFHLSSEEIARILGMRLNTVHQNLVRGMARLRSGRVAPEFEQWMSVLLGEDQG